jgi:NADPH:quinone reductase-like Zn-dependent oxidoreductase
MKAAIRRQYCAPKDLKVETIPTPTIQDDEVYIRVLATTVNRTDLAILSGKPFIMRLFTGLSKPKMPTPGTDFAGIIEAVGDKVQAFKPGDKVWGFNDEGLASQATYMRFSESGNIGLMPANLSFEQAAASLEGAHYARNFINKVTLQAGQQVLVNGASGAIGSVLVQFLKYHQLTVTAVCGTENVARIQALGADRIIDYKTSDFTQESAQYDFVFDAVGKSTFSKCKPLLKENGIYISSELGPNAQNPFLALITPLFGGKKVIFPLPTNIKASMLFIKDLIEKGQFTPLIDRSYALEEIAAAYQYVALGQKVGNVMVKMNEALEIENKQ